MDSETSQVNPASSSSKDDDASLAQGSEAMPDLLNGGQPSDPVSTGLERSSEDQKYELKPEHFTSPQRITTPPGALDVGSSPPSSPGLPSVSLPSVLLETSADGQPLGVRSSPAQTMAVERDDPARAAPSSVEGINSTAGESGDVSRPGAIANSADVGEEGGRASEGIAAEEMEKGEPSSVATSSAILRSTGALFSSLGVPIPPVKDSPVVGNTQTGDPPESTTPTETPPAAVSTSTLDGTIRKEKETKDGKSEETKPSRLDLVAEFLRGQHVKPAFGTASASATSGGPRPESTASASAMTSSTRPAASSSRPLLPRRNSSATVPTTARSRADDDDDDDDGDLASTPSPTKKAKTSSSSKHRESGPSTSKKSSSKSKKSSSK